jgi:HdeA/HdeB family
MMRNRLVVASLTLGAMLSGVLTPGPVAAAGAKKRVDQITCEEFLALDPDDQQRIAYWVDGYEEAKGEAAIGTVAFDKFGNPVGALVEDCRVTPKETLWQKLKKHI